jgi:hypothetical protein
MQRDVQHIPILRVVINRLLFLLAGFTARPLPVDYKIHASRSGEVCDATWDMMLQLYGLDQVQVLAEERRLAELRWPVVTLSSFVLDAIVAVDVPVGSVVFTAHWWLAGASTPLPGAVSGMLSQFWDWLVGVLSDLIFAALYEEYLTHRFGWGVRAFIVATEMLGHAMMGGVSQVRWYLPTLGMHLACQVLPLWVAVWVHTVWNTTAVVRPQ